MAACAGWSLKGRVAYDTAGHPVHTTGTITDITARKRLPQLLQAQKLESIDARRRHRTRFQ